VKLAQIVGEVQAVTYLFFFLSFDKAPKTPLRQQVSIVIIFLGLVVGIT
jgi:hypothetical protein